MNSRKILMLTASISLIIIVFLLSLIIKPINNLEGDKPNDVVDNNDNNDNVNDNNNNNNIVYNDISCSTAQYDSGLRAIMDANVKVSFDGASVEIVNTTIRYIYDTYEDYESWKQTYNSDNQIDINVPGVNSSYEFDDANKTIISNIEQRYKELPPENIDASYPTDYEGVKQYYQMSGYTCNF